VPIRVWARHARPSFSRAVPETAVPETAAPETAVPEIAVPEIAVPEIAVPETAAATWQDPGRVVKAPRSGLCARLIGPAALSRY
jgi:hypothetical protein